MQIQDETLLELLQTSVDIGLGKKTEDDLTAILVDFDPHQKRLISNLFVHLFVKAMSNRYTLEQFQGEVESALALYPEMKKPATVFWKRNSSEFIRQYEEWMPFENMLTDLKWSAYLPVASKYGLQSNQPSVKVQISATKKDVNMTFSALGLECLMKELDAIQATFQSK